MGEHFTKDFQLKLGWSEFQLDYDCSSPLDIAPKMLGSLSWESNHSHPNKSKDKSLWPWVSNTFRIKTNFTLGHLVEMETYLANGVTSGGYYFMVNPYANYSLHRMPTLTRHLWEHVRSLC